MNTLWKLWCKNSEIKEKSLQTNFGVGGSVRGGLFKAKDNPSNFPRDVV